MLQSANSALWERVPHAVGFSQQEAEVYLKVHTEARLVFDSFLRMGPKHVNGNMLAIMSLRGPLSRCCSGGELPERVRCLSSIFCAKLVAACDIT